MKETKQWYDALGRPSASCAAKERRKCYQNFHSIASMAKSGLVGPPVELTAEPPRKRKRDSPCSSATCVGSSDCHNEIAIASTLMMAVDHRRHRRTNQQNHSRIHCAQLTADVFDDDVDDHDHDGNGTDADGGGRGRWRVANVTLTSKANESNNSAHRVLGYLEK